MTTSVLYLGDCRLHDAAGYLAGVMTHLGIDYTRIESETLMDDPSLEGGYRLFILSDYPSSRFTKAQPARLAQFVENGASLLMIGGWGSFVGKDGAYQTSVLRDVLPVQLAPGDDRRNLCSPCVVTKTTDHECLAGLPLHENLPCIGGFNEVSAKPGSRTLLEINRFEACPGPDGHLKFTSVGRCPLLVLGRFGKGEVACFTSDAAPHWVGGLVDWGKDRVSATAPGARHVEVGSAYASLFGNLIRYLVANAFPA